MGLAGPAFTQNQRKDATDATKAANDRLLDELPFSDTTDFENAKRGLIAPLPNEVVQTEAGSPVWDPQRFSFITAEAEAP